MPVYIEKVEIWLEVTYASQKDRQTTEYSATQLVSNIKFKLSHATRKRRTNCPKVNREIEP